MIVPATNHGSKHRRGIVPAVVCLVLLAAAVGLWWGLRAEEDAHIRREADLEVARISSVIRRDLSLRIPALRRIAARWEQRGGTPEADWRADVARYLQDQPAYQALQWVDSNYRVRWIVPMEGNEQALGFDMASDPRRRRALDAAKTARYPTATAPIELPEGGSGLVVAAPIFASESLGGFIVGVFRSETLLDNALGAQHKYAIVVFDGEEEVYRRDDDETSQVAADAEIDLYGRTWRLKISPTPAFVAESRSAFPLIVLLFMGTFAFLVPGIMHATRRARRASAALDVANKELEYEVEKLDSVIAACPNGIVMVDEAGVITLVNAEADRLFGYDKDELLGQPIEALLPPSLRRKHEGQRNAYVKAPAPRRMSGRDLLGRRKDGSEFSIEIGLSRIETRDGPRVLRALADISDRKEAERIAALRTQDLERSNAELEQFAYVASHDLKEPLRMVASYTALLSQRYGGQLDAKADTYIDFAVDGAKRMQQLLDDLLVYSRVGTEGKPFEEVASSEAFNAALSNLQVALDETKAEVSHSDLPTVMADPVQLTQLFQNLAGNALKFHREDEPAKVHVAAEKNSKEWIFSVQDHGIGIEPQFSDRIFNVFQRLHGRDEYQGSGIGLAIAKKIVERHHGRIWVESDPGAGATFYFTLPLQQEQHGVTSGASA